MAVVDLKRRAAEGAQPLADRYHHRLAVRRDLEKRADRYVLHQFWQHGGIEAGDAGGVSEGLYRGLNVGLGSSDESDKVLENRRRVAAWFGL
ncbi:laccase domain-containing protein, partial [Rhizobium leguminosarum]|uniref:laccase domain-containing protein n=1 Tax=Rhizobium leguminosarum TaxID=384 RepID=UPI003F9499A9